MDSLHCVAAGLARRRQVPRPLNVVLIAVVTILALEASARLVLHGSVYWMTDPRVAADGYATADWTRAYYREFSKSGGAEWHSFVYWRRKPYTGVFINVDERGIRRTWADAKLPARHPRVFVFGGSTVWGTGARDDYTVPSWLAQALSRDELPVDVVNYGESGYVTRQAAEMLITELLAGRRPDVVVFTSGVEDTFAALQSGQVGLPQNEDNRRAEFNAMQPESLAQQGRLLVSGLEVLGARLRARFVRQPTAQTNQLSQTLAAEVVANYCATAAFIAALGDRYGFRSVFFWQPILFLKSQQTAYERAAERQYGYAAAFFADVYKVHAQQDCPGVTVHDVGPAIYAEAGPMFIDAFHLTEEGNRRIALAMLPAVSEALRRSETAGHR